MSEDPRLEILDRIADGVVGVNLCDVMGAYASLLLASLESAKRSSKISEPPQFAAMRVSLCVFLAIVGWSDVDVEVVAGRQQ